MTTLDRSPGWARSCAADWMVAYKWLALCFLAALDTWYPFPVRRYTMTPLFRNGEQPHSVNNPNDAVRLRNARRVNFPELIIYKIHALLYKAKFLNGRRRPSSSRRFLSFLRARTQGRHALGISEWSLLSTDRFLTFRLNEFPHHYKVSLRYGFPRLGVTPNSLYRNFITIRNRSSCKDFS